MADFDVSIELRYFTDNWGPYSIDIASAVPSGAAITDVTIKAYAKNVTARTDTSQLSEIQDQIVESGSVSFSGTQVFFSLQYPADETLKGKRCTLVFEITVTGGRQYPFYLSAVSIK